MHDLKLNSQEMDSSRSQDTMNEQSNGASVNNYCVRDFLEDQDQN